MAPLFNIIVARKHETGEPLTAREVEHLVLTTVAAALDMAINAVHNNFGTFPVSEMTLDEIKEEIDPAQIVEQLRVDFTESVQQYWPAPVQIGSARTAPFESDDQNSANEGYDELSRD